DAFAVPNFAMIELGTPAGPHYLGVDVMLTAERWTLPQAGIPEMLQQGEHDENGRPYIDHQHPHSSPLMGLTFSDSLTLNHDTRLKFFVAPRGDSTDGPIAFMHRTTGFAVNPDAPLGHHLGQDSGHISSTVIGTQLSWYNTRFELSTFNGTEPEPTKVD